jgi:subtilisin family serine protease
VLLSSCLASVLLLITALLQIAGSGRGADTAYIFTTAVFRAWEESAKAQCDVINMSFGFRGFVQPSGLYVDSLQPVIDADIIPVAAAGNDGGNSGEANIWSLASPSSMDGVISVVAVNNAEIPVTTFILDKNVTLDDEETNWICELVNPVGGRPEQLNRRAVAAAVLYH